MRSLCLSTQSSYYWHALNRLALVAVIVFVGGCNSSPTPPTRTQLGVVAPTPTTPPPPPTFGDLVVYLDISGSMKGYVKPVHKSFAHPSRTSAGNSIFSRTLLSLRDFAGNTQVKIHLRMVGAPQSDVKYMAVNIPARVQQSSLWSG
jgi:hypothetical protein